MTSAVPPKSRSKDPRRIAVICLRRLGDVLLTAPLIHCLRVAFPDARIEALVFAGTESALAGNPDLDAVLALPLRRGLTKLWPLFRRYHLAFCTQASDRPHLISWWIARRRVAVVPRPHQPGYWWKRAMAWRWSELPSGDAHTVVQYLRLADVCGIPVNQHGLPPHAPDDSRIVEVLGADWMKMPYAVLHPAPKFRYKEWTDEGWCGLIRWLTGRGFAVMLSGSGDAQEIQRAQALVRAAPGANVHQLAGRLSLGDLTRLIERARVFVGPDTSITHLAAMTGAPTVALFGPSSPTVWGPWPQTVPAEFPSPWRERAPLQQKGNVWLLQGLAPCMPCLLEGCERWPGSYSQCLDELPLTRVVGAVEAALALSSGASDAGLRVC